MNIVGKAGSRTVAPTQPPYMQPDTATAGNADTTFSLIAPLANHISGLILPHSLSTDCGTTVTKETRHHRWSRNQHGTGHRPSCSLVLLDRWQQCTSLLPPPAPCGQLS